MKYLKSSILFFLTGLLCFSVQAKDQENQDQPAQVMNPEVFAQVNGVPLSLDLYHFLAGSREQDQEKFQESDSIDVELNRQQVVKDLVMTEVLTQEAMKQNLHQHPQVLIELEMAKKTLLAQLYVQQMMANFEIDDAHIREAYKAKKETVMYRFMIWRSNDQAQAKQWLNTLKAGKQEQNADSELAKSAIESPWLRDVDIDPAVNDIALKLEVNEFVPEPVFQEGVWKVIQIIDKNVLSKQTYEEEYELIRAELVRMKLDEQLEALAKASSIVFNEQHIVEMK